MATLPQIDDDDDLDDFLPKPEKKRRINARLLSRVLVTAILLVGAFVGGVDVQKRNQPSTTAAAAASARSGTRAGAQTGAQTRNAAATQGQGQTQNGGATIGTVKAVEGDAVYITDSSGNVVKVVTDSTSTVTKTTTVPLTDLKPGQSVVVQGTKAEDGTVTARSVTQGGGGGGFTGGPPAG